MSVRKGCIGWAVLIGVALLMWSSSRSSCVNGEGKSFICNTTLPGLLTCKPAATLPPPPPPPTAACCKVLSGADLTCLCKYKNSSVLVVIGIDPTLALQLPGKCNISHPVC